LINWHISTEFIPRWARSSKAYDTQHQNVLVLEKDQFQNNVYEPAITKISRAYKFNVSFTSTVFATRH